MTRASRVAARVGPLALLILAPVTLLWRLLLGGQVLYWGVVLLQFNPWHALTKHTLLRGHVPLWSHHLGFGAPLVANLQSAVLYPLSLLYLALPVDVSNGALMAIHLSLAGLFMYWYVRSLSVSTHGALVSGLSYGLGGYVVGRSQFVTMVAAYAWLPLVFWLADRAVQRPRWTRIAALGAGLAVQLLAGHAQTSYYTVLALTPYLLWRATSGASGRRWVSAARRGLLVLIAGGALALALSAAQVLPTAELLIRSQRPQGVDQPLALTYSMWPWRLLTLLSPDLFGSPASGTYWGYGNYWEDCAYLGLLPLGLAVYAVARALASRRFRAAREAGTTLFMAVMAVIGVLLALGNHSLLYMAAHRWLPGMALFQAPSRLLVLFAFAAAVLAGIGFHALPASAGWRRRGRLLAAGAVSAVVVSLVARASAQGNARTVADGVLRSGAAIGAIGVWLAAVPVAGNHTRVGAWRWAGIALIMADLLTFGTPLVPTTEPDSLRVASPLSNTLSLSGARVVTSPTFEYRAKFEQFTRFSAFGPSDVETIRAFRDSLLPNATALEGLDNARNYDPLLDRRYAAFIDALNDMPWEERRSVLARSNVGFFVTDAEVTGAQSVTGLPAFEGLGSVARYIYSVDPLPRARLVYTYTAVPDERAALECLRANSGDTGRACIEAQGDVTLQVPALPSAGDSVSARFLDNEAVVHIVAGGPAYLFIAQMDYPGWTARVDGMRTSILRADYLFQAVAVPPGQHEVTLRYEPASWWFGIAISSLAAAVLLVGLVAELLARRRRSQRLLVRSDGDTTPGR